MPSVARLLPLIATILAAPMTVAWGAERSARLARPVAAAGSPGADAGVELTRAGDGLFYAIVRVNGRPVRFLVDTGSNVMMLTAADARRVGLTRADERSGASVATAGGTTSLGWARLDTVELGNRRLRDVRAGVVHAGLPVSLLGQTMLSRFAAITIAGDRMRME